MVVRDICKKLEEWKKEFSPGQRDLIANFLKDDFKRIGFIELLKVFQKVIKYFPGEDFGPRPGEIYWPGASILVAIEELETNVELKN